MRQKGSRRSDTSRTLSDERYIGIGELRELFPVSDMTFWRWQRNPSVGFPQPVKLGANGRNYWWLPAIKEWQAQREGQAA
jgi:predicted DNA-binding transcriptional regulator AlpA